MKIARCARGSVSFWAVVNLDAGVVRPLEGPALQWAPLVTGGAGERALPFTGECWPLSEVLLLPPIERGSRAIIVGANYSRQVKEFGMTAPPAPFAFMKPLGAFIGPNDDIVHSSLTRQLDHEVELVAVVGAKPAGMDNFMTAVLGYTVGNDVSARDLQKGPGGAIGMDLFSGKGLDRTTALGPWIVTREEFGDRSPDLRLILKVNGEVRQDGRSGQMTWPVGELLAYVDARSAWEPGDVLFTGTPGGVGQSTGRFLGIGDVVEATIERIGTLRNVVRGPARRV